MAIFNEINKRSGLVVGTVVVALVLFLLTDAFFGQNSFFNRGRNNVGEIAGENISAEEFQAELQRAEQEFMISRNATPTENDRQMIQETAWNQLIYKYAYQNQFEKLGLTVTEEEWLDIAKGDFIHPMVKQLFGNPENFNKEMVNNFIANLNQYPAQDQTLWYYVDTKLPEVRLREKYSNLLKKSEYVTTAEAKREYVAQNEKADAKYLSIPYFSVPDSVVNVTDSELEAYISRNEELYQVEPGRSLDYVVFTVQPSAQDSIETTKELEQLSREFAATENDSAFTQFNSDEPVPFTYKRMGDLPEELQNNAGSITTNKVYGPYNEDGTFKLVKITDIKADSIFSSRASHILFKPADNTDAAKAEAKKQAEKVLAEIKAGASFEEKAKLHGTDATAPRGGDLGWFKEGDMVPEFNDAVFKSGQQGLLPKLVETQFGYHIIKITEPKIKKQFKIAEINRKIDFSEETKERVYQQAVAFANDISDTAEFYKKIKEDKNLTVSNAKNIRQNERNLNNISNARELIKWAYNEAGVGDVSPVVAVDDKFIVAILTDKTEKGLAELKDVKDEVKTKVLQEKKAALVLEKIKGAQGTLEEIAANYGPSASTGKAEAVSLSSNYVQGLGFDPVAIGRIFGLKPNQKSEPFEGQSGVVIVELTNLVAAPEVADYASYKNQAQQQRVGRTEFLINEAVKKAADVEDSRYKFY